MKNPAIFYAVIALGVIAIAVGVYYMASPGAHHVRAYTGLGVGIVLLFPGGSSYIIVHKHIPGSNLMAISLARR